MPWQPAAIVYPDVEGLVCDYLRAALVGRSEAYATDVYIDIKIPNPREPVMVIPRRDGGSEGELRDQARVSFQVFAESEQDANDLAALVLALLRAMPGQVADVLQVAVQSGPTAVGDPSAKPKRYIVAEIHTRGAQLS